MCGRFTLRVGGRALAEHFELAETPDLEARYNIAPAQDVAVVRETADAGRALDALRWGFGPDGRLINARSETAAERPSFASAFRERRCLVPADGFFEWTGPPRARRAVHVRVGGAHLFAMAGLWQGRACTILTTDAHPTLRRVHDRMPVILDPAAYARWLDPKRSDPAELRDLLRPWPGELELVPVGSRVNRIEHDDPACLEPDPQGDLFGAPPHQNER